MGLVGEVVMAFTTEVWMAFLVNLTLLVTIHPTRPHVDKGTT